MRLRRKERQDDAIERQGSYSKLSVQQKIDKAEASIGESKKELIRLRKQLAKESK